MVAKANVKRGVIFVVGSLVVTKKDYEKGCPTKSVYDHLVDAFEFELEREAKRRGWKRGA